MKTYFKDQHSSLTRSPKSSSICDTDDCFLMWFMDLKSCSRQQVPALIPYFLSKMADLSSQLLISKVDITCEMIYQFF